MLIVLVPLTFTAIWLLLFDRAGRVSLRASFVDALVIGFTAVTAVTELLSLAGLVKPWAAGFIWTLIFAALAFRLGRRTTDIAGVMLRRLRGGFGSLPTFFLTITAIVILVTFAIAIISPPNTYDSQTYHMARVVNWIQNGSVAHYPTVILRQLYQPPLSEFAILQLQLLSAGDHFANLVQWASLVGCAAAVSVLVASFGLEIRFQALAAALAVTIPGAVVQGSSTQNDLVASLMALAFFFHFKRAKDSGRTGDFVFAGMALGLGVLTKGTMYLYCFPIGLFFSAAGLLKAADRAARLAFARRVAIVLAIGVAINLGHFTRNTKVFGSPVTSGDDDVRNQTVSARIVFANAARNYAVNLATKSETMRFAIESSLRRVFGAELRNPNSTWLDNEFKVEYSTHEDLAANVVHTLLVTVALGALFFAYRRGREPDVLGAAFTVVTGFLLFSALLKWQIWSARLILPLLMLGSVVAVFVIARLTPRIVPEAITAIALVVAVPFLLMAEPRRVFANDGAFVLFRDSRQTRLFKNLADAGPLYAEAAQIINGRPADDVGIAIEYNDFEYPLWELLKPDPRSRPKLCHVGVANVSKKLAPRCSAPPEIVFTTRTENTIDGVNYREIWKKDVIRVLERTGQ